jgi:murein DD-endopeptidase MepM/ murein hydrolase activator NlpD
MVAFGNPVKGRIQPKGEKWDGRGFRQVNTFADHVTSGRPPGNDFGDGREGDAVLAVDAGTIVRAFRDPGGALVIRQRAASQVGTIIGYAHLSRFAVSDGQVVKRGQTIGYVGSTGAPGQPHLHWGVNVNGREVDGWPMLAQNQEEPVSETIVTYLPFPEGQRTWRAKGGQTVGYKPDGTTKTVVLAVGSQASASGTAHIAQDPQKAPNGSGFILIANGILAGFYVLGSAGILDAPPPVRTYSQGYNDGLADAEKAVDGVPEK